jgi:hypothetical protein
MIKEGYYLCRKRISWFYPGNVYKLSGNLFYGEFVVYEIFNEEAFLDDLKENFIELTEDEKVIRDIIL